MTIHKALATLLLATLLLAIPTPSNSTARSTSEVSTMTTAVPASRVLSTVAAAAHITTLPKGLTPTLEDAARDGGDALSQTQPGCYAVFTQTSVPACVWGDRAGSHTLVLLGDSHARMWLSAFDVIGKRLHWKVVLLAKSGCPPPYTGFSTSYRKTYPECDRWHGYTIARINRMNPDVVVMSGNDGYPRDSQRKHMTKTVWAAGLLKTLNMITSTKTKKVVIGDVPRPGHNPWSNVSGPYCLAAHEDDVQACSSQRATVLKGLYNDVEQSVAKQAGAQYIDVFPWFCSSVCTEVIGNMVVFLDQNHITSTYATYLSGALQAALQPAMTRVRS
jgi:SGNH domain (fused to AT3 domains)